LVILRLRGRPDRQPGKRRSQTPAKAKRKADRKAAADKAKAADGFASLFSSVHVEAPAAPAAPASSGGPQSGSSASASGSGDGAATSAADNGDAPGEAPSADGATDRSPPPERQHVDQGDVECEDVGEDDEAVDRAVEAKDSIMSKYARSIMARLREELSSKSATDDWLLRKLMDHPTRRVTDLVRDFDVMSRRHRCGTCEMQYKHTKVVAEQALPPGTKIVRSSIDASAYTFMTSVRCTERTGTCNLKSGH
jgi:hypothetical protein